MRFVRVYSRYSIVYFGNLRSDVRQIGNQSWSERHPTQETRIYFEGIGQMGKQSRRQQKSCALTAS